MRSSAINRQFTLSSYASQMKRDFLYLTDGQVPPDGAIFMGRVAGRAFSLNENSETDITIYAVPEPTAPQREQRSNGIEKIRALGRARRVTSGGHYPWHGPS